MNSAKILIGVAAGIAAGALLGVLFAPAKGSDTRKKISKTSKDLTDTVKGKYSDIIETISGPFISGNRKTSHNSRPTAVKPEIV